MAYVLCNRGFDASDSRVQGGKRKMKRILIAAGIAAATSSRCSRPRIWRPAPIPRQRPRWPRGLRLNRLLCSAATSASGWGENA